MVIHAHRRHQVECSILKRNLEWIGLNACLDTGNPTHHIGGHIASRGMRKITSKLVEQLTFSAAYIQMTKSGCFCLPAPEESSDQLALASMEKHRFLPGESIAEGIAQEIVIRRRQLIESGRLAHLGAL